MTQEQHPEETQTTEESQTQEPEYYHSANRYWHPNRGTKRIHHKDTSCRIGGRIKKQNRLEGRREDTSPCPVCCSDEMPQEQDAQVG